MNEDPAWLNVRSQWRSSQPNLKNKNDEKSKTTARLTQRDIFKTKPFTVCQYLHLVVEIFKFEVKIRRLMVVLTRNTPTAIKNYVPMATHSLPVPNRLDFNMSVIFSSKTLNETTNSTRDQINMLARSCIWGTNSKYQNETSKVASKAFNIGLVLWSTFSRILLQSLKYFWQTGWDIFLYNTWSKFGWVYDVIT